MAGFSATDAAFTGFRVVWRHPRAVAIWAALQFAFLAGQTLFITLSAGPLYMQIMQALSTPTPTAVDVANLMARAEAFAPTLLALSLAELVVGSVLRAAMNRAVLRPEQSSFGYLRLASDELRQLGLFLLIGTLVFLLATAAIVIAQAAAFLLGGTMGDAGLALTGLILMPLFVFGAIVLGVRFSLASALTFDRGRIDLLGSWRLTRGRFWALFFSYTLAFILSLIVWALMLAISFIVLAILGGGFGALGAGADPDTTSLVTAFTPASVLFMAITAISSALRLPITAAPPASVYRALEGGGAGASKMFE